ncbi:MAG: TonB-dependent receptor [Alteromonadaceae bacterium]|nr:MAG: TonB-dependent receptor [Alteromonadaceae bacterium]
MKRITWMVCFALTAVHAKAQEQNQLEEVLVHGHQVAFDVMELKASALLTTDTSDMLKLIPGANVNKNGAISGIAQYRGLYGDRVAVSLDGTEVISGGPNAMDAPLSYSSPMITKKLSLDRGVASVSSASESLGGHIRAELDRGEFNDGDDFVLDGFIGTRIHTNGDTNTSAVRLTGASKAHRVTVLAEADRGDNIDTPKGEIDSTELSRDRLDLSYAMQTEKSEFSLYWGLLDTQDSGTPALAMDIRSIETDLAGAQFAYKVSDKLKLHAKVALSDVEHSMDNFSIRKPPALGAGYRLNSATSDGFNLKLGGAYALGFAELRFGFDAKTSEHNSTITNPNAAVFKILNFNGSERKLNGTYSELAYKGENSHWELGLRYNRVSTDTDEVSLSGAMGMMAVNANLLSTAFNSADRQRDFNNVDFVAKYGYSLGDNTKLLIELGSKTRAPNHQELYLWLPLQSTGGLADGRNYIGNLDLEVERANEISLGFDFSNDKGMISPQLFFRKVDDYIQGTTTMLMPANMVATMMSGAPALQFNNVDAEFYGLDLAWLYVFNDIVYADGVVSLLDSKRTDTDDALYRQSPSNARFALNYKRSGWHAIIETVVYDSLSDVSKFNDEQKSDGYGLLNLQVSWEPMEQVKVDVRVDNLLDETYQDHLAGVNRVAGTDIPQGSRIFGAERSFVFGLRYDF